MLNKMFIAFLFFLSLTAIAASLNCSVVVCFLKLNCSLVKYVTSVNSSREWLKPQTTNCLGKFSFGCQAITIE